MSIILSPSSRQMKNYIISIQYSDEIITKSISRAHEGNFAHGLELLVHFQIGFRVKGYWWLLSCGFFRWVLLVAFLLENLEPRG